MKVLILYSSKTGTTEKCARILSECLGSESSVVNLANAGRVDLSKFDGVILGSYIRVSKAPRKVRNFVEKNLELLKKKRLGVFLCMGETPDRFEEFLSNNFSKDFLDSCYVKGYFGGEFNFKKMGFLTRKVVQKISEGRELPFVREENIEKFAKDFEMEG
ncbi:flavodoxin domain-containing protein [Kosmotoga pacifica]|uniref:Flavodoxin n=1 Tax=Kosmotoga pacifica TaxID=1330330 RepID=A0A0G2ZC76_9BACT|nr:flavodoxin domain-containing protein [Kosmotoga pacifica]AKI97691.1 flavodoxin [Kosmotoga pacifica]